MARVNDAEVKKILETSETSFTTFITSANLLVNATLSNPGILTDADLLKQIELYLAAHFFSIKELKAKKEETGETLSEYYGTSGMGLDFTPYGQQVKFLDTTGTFASLGKESASVETLEAISFAQ